MKLGNRLQTLCNLISDDMHQYDHIWDCCCDHGLLGMALLESNNANIHFVDVVPHIMDELEKKLLTNFPNCKWQTHCLDVANLPIHNSSNNKHLVIIAGVGGDLTADLVTAIFQKNSSKNIDFLLCPVHRIYNLRQEIINLDLRLKNECIIEENSRFYEAIYLTNDQNHAEKVHPVGSLLWQTHTNEQTDIAQIYLQQNLNHYQKVLSGYKKQQNTEQTKETKKIITLYQSVNLK